MCCPRGISKKSATLLIAAMQFMHGFFTFISAAITVNHTSRVAFLVVVFVAAIYMWLALVLFVGVNTKRINMLILWLAWSAVILILFVIGVPFMALYAYKITDQHFKGANFASAFLMFPLSFFLHCFFIHVVYGYYEELVRQRIEEELYIENTQGQPRTNQVVGNYGIQNEII